jgi:hypothetical protein
MIVLRLCKALKTYKVMGARVVDKNTLEYHDASAGDIKRVMLNQPGLIQNATIDDYGNIKLKSYNPDKSRMAYLQTYSDNGLQINHYCAITGYNKGLINYIADTPSRGVIRGEFSTLGEMANNLGVDIKDIKLLNGYIEFKDNKPEIYLFRKGEYIKVPDIEQGNKRANISNVWNYEIDKYAQEGLYLSYIERVKPAGRAEIPGGICHIEEFGGGVNNLILPQSIRTLGKKCFTEIDDLYTIIIGEGLQVIPESCFEDSSLKRIRFSGQEHTISDSAFANCSDLSGVIVTSALYIGKRAFLDTDISVLNLLRAREIDEEAFAYNSKLRKVKLNDGIKIIGHGAFRGCTNLETVNIPMSAVSIGDKAFDGCDKLQKITLAQGVKISRRAIPHNVEVVYY